jgi:hypothetical protein
MNLYFQQFVNSLIHEFYKRGDRRNPLADQKRESVAPPLRSIAASAATAPPDAGSLSRHLPPELKARHPAIPWQKVAGIGNVLRHNYENIAAPVMWKLARDDLDALEQVCRAELIAAEERDRPA